MAVCACVGLSACRAAGNDPSGTTNSGTDTESSSESGEPAAFALAEPTIIHHPGQPMIIDVVCELTAPGTGELTHLTDDDVRVFLLGPGEGEPATSLHFRVRGLRPGTVHGLALTVSEANGDRTAQWQGEVTTDPALPGYVAKFEIDSLGAAAVDPSWRLFDMTQLFTASPSGVFLVDDEGTTRWYLGDADDYTDIADIFTGVKLRPDGTVSYLRRNSAYVVDEFGGVVMQVEAASIGAPAGLHHDLIELPSGNFMALGYSFQDVDYQGEGTLHVAGDTILEFTPAGELVWSWDTFDHLDPQRRRDGFFIPMMIPDPNSPEDGHDWTHANGLVYTANDDTILLSMRHQDWIIAIDHGTGEVLWRLGDEGDFSLDGDRWFFHQHSPQWQADGSLMLYDNAVGNPAQPDDDAHSRAVRFALNFNSMTAKQVWTDDDSLFSSPIAGDADVTPSGHVLRLDSTWTSAEHPDTASRLRELDPAASPQAVWTLFMPPGQFSYRAVPVSRFVGVAE
ncbi:putative arylsulfate sulfotransferase [Enhygromyxa salina]|uniref:Putative arylsulfate sulfotransferase n=1 Tax=Enhygromyxa salina TaxID=215803 RepID=A0A0C2CXK2_9BACT|nr:putative arylsulfate sulfotransferase [Enhygromyxa salina]